MEKPYSIYKIINTDYESYFIGANTEKGFVLSRDFNKEEGNLDKLTIIKGGPGTGKSTLMKKISSSSEGSIQYFCSSDPDSLDGVEYTLDGKRCAVCDGTAPHVVEMGLPGAVSEIINLSEYWKSSYLQSNREIIAELSNKKSECFKGAYTYLKSASEVQKAILKISLKVCDTDKLKSAVTRLIGRYKINKGVPRTVYTEAFSMKGCFALDTFFKTANEVYYLKDYFGVSSVYLSTLKRKLDEMGAEYTAIMSPVNTEEISGIYLNFAKVFITHGNYDALPVEGKSINLKRFVLPTASNYRNRYSMGVRCHNTLLKGAADYLARAREYHYELEKIYVKSMNFKRIDKLSEKL